MTIHMMDKPSRGQFNKETYKCTLQVGPLFLEVHTNLNPLKVFTSSCSKPPTCSYNGILWNSIFTSNVTLQIWHKVHL